MAVLNFLNFYGRLRVMNLQSGEVHSFTLREDQVSMSPLNDVDAFWTTDSSMCVLPPPPVEDRRVVIKLATDGKPTVSFLAHPRKPRKPGEPTPDAQIKMPEQFTCSDCFPHTSNFELLKKHIPKELLFVGNAMTPNERAQQIVSPDGAKIYFQRGPQVKPYPPGNQETTLFEVDISSGKERTLITHDGTCPTIERLRPSPDGKKLAYQVTTGCGSGVVTEIYVLDLNTAKTEFISLGGGPMHWTSTSDKLIFYRKFKKSPHEDHLWVAEWDRDKPPANTTTQPAVRRPSATTKPASEDQ